MTTNQKETERLTLHSRPNNELTKNNSQDQPNIIKENENVNLHPIVNNQFSNNTNQQPKQANAVPVLAAVPFVQNNDIQGFVPIINPKEFGSKPVSTYCPNCRFPVTTDVKKSCNCCSCCFCYICFYFWIFIQCCRNKEITFCDYQHTCPRCGFVIGNYDAW